MRRFVSVVALLLAAALSTQAQTPPPQYDAKFVLTDGQAYTGTTTFVVDGKGVVTGKMLLTQPMIVNSTLDGTLKDGIWTFNYSYTVPDENCTGVVTGTAKVPTDRKLISGNAMISGGCTETPLAAVFTFALQEKKGG
jgi:hypothetical protein